MSKQLWRGAFNYRQSVIVLYTYAYTERQAWLVFCRRLAKKHGVSLRTVMGLFDGTKDNYQITKEVEYRDEN